MAKANFYDTAYLTTCIVPVYDAKGVVVNTHHSHFSIGPRVENGIRDIMYDCHPTCRGGLCMYRAQRVPLDMIVTLGFDTSTVTDWTDEEAAVLSGVFCPTSKAQYDAEQRIAAAVEERVLLTEEAEKQRRLADEAEEQRREAEQSMWEDAWIAAAEAAADERERLAEQAEAAAASEQSDGYESDEAL